MSTIVGSAQPCCAGVLCYRDPELVLVLLASAGAERFRVERSADWTFPTGHSKFMLRRGCGA